MENKNVTTIHTDNLPTVHAWKRMKAGAFSTSARVASFLTGLSTLSVELVHRPGRKMLVSDYNSRHPNSCTEPRCKICDFAFNLQQLGDNATPMICSISASDVENGTAKMPFLQKAAWAKVQATDKAHQMLFKLIETSGIPERKKTTGDHTRVKRLHNLYRNGQLKIDRDGLTTVKHIDNAGNEFNAISVPHNFFPGLVQSLHLKLNHPSKAQMHRLISRYFYCAGYTRIVNDVVANCQLCRSLQELPKELFSESTESTPIFGGHFSADVIKKDGQLIFVCREKLSQFTSSQFIPDETADSLRDAIINTVIELMPDQGTVVQVDCAPGLQSLAAECKMDGSDLKKLGIVVDLGRTFNTNKNPIAENCIKEFHKERLRLNIPNGRLSEINRAIITKNMNSRIRERGFTPKEMAMNREQMSNAVKLMSDDKLSEVQTKNRIERHNPIEKKNETNMSIGEDVYLKNDKSKHRGREVYKIIKLYNKGEEEWAVVQKNNDLKFMSKEYDVKLAEIFPVSENHPTSNSISKRCRPPSTRKAARKARKALNSSTKMTRLFSNIHPPHEDNMMTDPPPHAFLYSDWLKLQEEEDDSTPSSHFKPSNVPTSAGINTNLTTPSINSLLRFNIAQLQTRVQSSSNLLQRFMPEDEPEPLWDHSPEYLIQDGQIEWNDSLNVDQKIDHNLDEALAPRRLFHAEESISDSLTSSTSDDSTFLGSPSDRSSSYRMSRADRKRQGFKGKRNTTQSLTGLATSTDFSSSLVERELSPNYEDVSNLAQYELEVERVNSTKIGSNRNRTEIEQTDSYGVDSHIMQPSFESGYQDVVGEQGASHSALRRPFRASRRSIDYKSLHRSGWD